MNEIAIPEPTAIDSIRSRIYTIRGVQVILAPDLADMYRRGEFRTLEMDVYLDILGRCVDELPEEMVVHRLTGDGPKRILIAPLWSGDKKKVVNAVRRMLEEKDEQRRREDQRHEASGPEEGPV